MKSRVYFLVLVCQLFLGAPLFAGGLQDEGRTTFIFENRAQEIVKEIESLSDGQINFETPFFSDKEIVKSLCDAAERGIEVVVRTTSRAKADLDKLRNANVTVKIVPNLHAKRVVLIEKENAENGQGKQVVFEGSDNLSVFSLFHKEVMAKTEGDSEYAQRHKDFFASPQPSKKRKMVEVTPQKRGVFSSNTHDLNCLLAGRIRTLADRQTPGNSMDIESMTFDSEEVVKAIEDVYTRCDKENRPRIRLFLDRTAKAHQNLLDRMKNAGEDDLQIFIYNEDGSEKIFGKVPKLQHRKGSERIIRQPDGQIEVVRSCNTANLTRRSALQDFNTSSIHRLVYPGDADAISLFGPVKKFNDELALESTEYQGSAS